MKKFFAKMLYGVVICEVLLGLYLGFMAYFFRSYDRVSGRTFDGLGRSLEPAPFIVRFIFGSDSYWAGWLQFGLELVIFWGGVGLGTILLNLASKLSSHAESTK